MNGLTVTQQQAKNEQELQDIFTSALTHVLDFTPYKSEWANGLGYMDDITKYELAVGEVIKSQHEDGRRVIIVGTAIGSVVVFERYALGHGPFVLVSHGPDSLGFIIGAAGQLDIDTFQRILTHYNPRENIGNRLGRIEKVLSVHARVKARKAQSVEEAEIMGLSVRG